MKKISTGLIVILLVISLSSLSVWAMTLGNDAIDRTYGADNWTAYNFTMLDVEPLDFHISGSGNVQSWHLFAEPQNSGAQTIDLEVWRPTGGINEFQLIVRQTVTVTDYGLTSITATPMTMSKVIEPGDVLGFYVPDNSHPVITLDYIRQGTPSDPYYLHGGGDFTEGSIYTFNAGNGTRTYSLYVEVDPVPEPTTMLLVGFGLVGLAGVRRKFKK